MGQSIIFQFAGHTMKFSHLVKINDPLNPLIDSLTREQLWRGLVIRAEQPILFVKYLDDCVLSEQSMQSVTRELRYGKVVVRDIVTYLSQLQARYQVPKQQDLGGSSLIMTIEEPEPEMLFIRFEYEDDAVALQPAAQAEQEFYDEFRRSAYQEGDIDTVRVICELAAEGRLA